MSRFSNVLKKGVVTPFFCFVAIFAISMATISFNANAASVSSTKRLKTAKNSFVTPDFAFPKDVQKNAVKEYEDAIKANDGEKALIAAIQLDIAAAQISSESYSSSLERFDSLSRTLNSPWSDMALILEAKLYSSIYQENRWTYNRRTLPLNQRPASVKEWSQPMFQQVCLELLNRAMANINSLDKLPISSINGLIIDYEQAEKVGFSLADFVTLQAVDILTQTGYSQSNINEIPFGKKGVLSDNNVALNARLEWLDGAITRHADDADKCLYALFCLEKLQCLSAQDCSDWLMKCVQELGETRYGAPFVVQYCNMLSNDQSDANLIESESRGQLNEQRRKVYDILTTYEKAFPEAPEIGSVLQAINRLQTESIAVRNRGQVLANKEVEVALEGANLYDFYLLCYRMPNGESDNYCKVKDVLSKGELVHTQKISLDYRTPDTYSAKQTLPALRPGLYVFIPSKSAKTSGLLMDKNESVGVTHVSDLSAIVVPSIGDFADAIYVVNGNNQQPIYGAKVTFKQWKNRTLLDSTATTTDINGKAKLPKIDNASYVTYFAEYEGSFVDGKIYRNNVPSESKEKIQGRILTDLSVYRPGQKLGFLGVIYSSHDKTLKVVKDQEILVRLYDANRQKVDSVKLSTDCFGRINGEFTIPTNGVLGRMQIDLICNNIWVASESISVAEYKSPTFYVTIDSSSEGFEAGKDISFNGSAVTYAGLPVAGAKVAYTVNYKPCWWRTMGNPAQYGGVVTAGNDGKFSIVLPTDNLVGTDYAVGSYVLNVSVTDASGETQQSQPMRFSLGKDLHIVVDMPEIICADKGVDTYSVAVYDMSSHPVVKTIYYRYRHVDSKEFVSGEFSSPKFEFDYSTLKSGEYEFSFSLNRGFVGDDNIAKTNVIVWRENDKFLPTVSALWLPESVLVTPKDAKNVKVKVGSSYENSYILAFISDTHKIIESRWLPVSNGFVDISINAPAANENIFVEFLAERYLVRSQKMVTIKPYSQTLMPKVAVDTFRDNITPGSRESWKFRFSCDDKACKSLPVAAVMSNKALNVLAPFNWNFSPYSQLYWNHTYRLNYDYVRDVTNRAYISSDLFKENKPLILPSWNFYGYSLAGNGGLYANKSVRIRSYGASKSMKLAATESVVEEESADNYASDSIESSTADGVADSANDDTQLRDVEMPLAFFMPELVTDNNGEVIIDFVAPQFVGTWQLQLLGYTPDMKGTVLTLDAISAKSVIAQMNAPRFMRTGDKVSVSASLFNNGLNDKEIAGTISFVDPISGEQIAEQYFTAENVAASASRTITAWLIVPTDIDAIEVIVRAISDITSDGEKTIIPVLPSSAPIIESTPFYIAADKSVYNFTIPEFEADSKVTLKYCDNPVWECVTALPSMLKSESASIITQAEALFGNAVAAGLFKRYPKLIEGVVEMSKSENVLDSTLYSPLAKNENLKTLLLNNTPWVNDAQSESARMQSLVQYSDTAASNAAIAEILKTIEERQNSDGGWSWCPSMESSGYITSSVLHTLSLLSDMGYLPSEGESLAKKAFNFMDNLYVKEWNLNKKKYFSKVALINYLYDKSSFSKIGSISAFKSLESQVLKCAKSDWRKFSIRDKATTAILLKRRGESKTANLIMESLRQFASISEQRGMWFDAESSTSPEATLLTTSRVLQAFVEVSPESKDIDLLRQWLVVSKQTQNWGDCRYSAEAVNALLSIGSDWTSITKSPEVFIGGKQLDLGNVAAVTGAFTINIDKANSGENLSIIRHSTAPAWGGVVAQYVAPIVDVKSSSVPQLSIEKKLYSINPTDVGTKALSGNLKIGDKVRVTLTIVCDRDIEYLAVTDSRSACLEPVEQISGRAVSDGISFYRETRNSASNLFIPYLPKGTHVISYDCYADRVGEYTLGIATAQSQYAPEIIAHSAGVKIVVEE